MESFELKNYISNLLIKGEFLQDLCEANRYQKISLSNFMKELINELQEKFSIEAFWDCGVEKHVIIIPNHFVIKFCDEEAAFNEYNNYIHSLEAGFSNFFAKTEKPTKFSDLELVFKSVFYFQEYIPNDEEINLLDMELSLTEEEEKTGSYCRKLNFNYEGDSAEEDNTSYSFNEVSGYPTIRSWKLFLFLSKMKDEGCRFMEFLIENKINDLHSDNFRLRNNSFVLIDFGGYSE